MNSNPDHITLQIPATPELMAVLKELLSNGAGVSFSSTSGSVNDMIPLRQGAKECGYSYDVLRKWVVDEQRIPFTRPSGAPKGKIFIKRSDLQSLIMEPDQGCNTPAKPGRPRLSTRVSIL